MSLVYKLRSQFAEYAVSKDVSFLGFFSHVMRDGAEQEMFVAILMKNPLERKHVDTRM